MGTHPIFESDFDCLTEYEIEMDLSIIDVYIIVGVLCATILISTIICLVIYCHWHRNHYHYGTQKVSRIYFQSSSDQVAKHHSTQKKFSLKRLFRIKGQSTTNSTPGPPVTDELRK